MNKIIEEKKSSVIEDNTPTSKGNKKRCFVIMPISDTEPYLQGHFDRVFEFFIKPACMQAGFEAVRADKNPKTDFIVIEIIRQIVECDMAICDLSSRNPNVFYELGLRQAFDLKTVLIKDEQTPRPFDISGLRTLEYKSTLRIDEVKNSIDELSKVLTSTYEQREKDGNSLIQLLAVMTPAKIPDDVQLGKDTSILLNEIRNLRIDMQHVQNKAQTVVYHPFEAILPNGEIIKSGSMLYLKSDKPFNDEYGEFIRERENAIDVKLKDGSVVQLSKEPEDWKNLTILPF